MYNKICCKSRETIPIIKHCCFSTLKQAASRFRFEFENTVCEYGFFIIIFFRTFKLSASLWCSGQLAHLFHILISFWAILGNKCLLWVFIGAICMHTTEHGLVLIGSCPIGNTVQCTQDQQNTNKQITESATASAVAVALTAAAKAASASSVEATLASAAVAASAKKKAKKLTQKIDC